MSTRVSTYTAPDGSRHARITRGALPSILITREGQRITSAGRMLDTYRVWEDDRPQFGIARGTFREAVRAARRWAAAHPA